jgi:hypothetical protein
MGTALKSEMMVSAAPTMGPWWNTVGGAQFSLLISELLLKNRWEQSHFMI